MNQHLEHFRGGKLLDDEATLVDGLEGHLTFRLKSGGRKEWHGYFELPADCHVEPGTHYRLVLADGRYADITSGDIDGTAGAGGKTHLAAFYVVGEVHAPGRRAAIEPGRKSLRS